MISRVSPQHMRDARDRDALSLWETQPLPHMSHVRAQPFVVVHPSHRGSQTRAAHRVSHLLPMLLLLFAALNICDVVSTYVGLHNGLREGNPLMSGLLSQHGFGALLLYKALVVLVVSLGVYFLRAFSPRVAHATIWICNGLVLAVVLLNILQFLLS